MFIGGGLLVTILIIALNRFHAAQESNLIWRSGEPGVGSKSGILRAPTPSNSTVLTLLVA